MNYKKDIETILNSLKNYGYDRTRIEKEANYSENYIDQQLSKGGNKRFVNSLKQFRDRILQKTTSSGNEVNEDHVPVVNLQTLIIQQNKLIVSMNRQSETANAILQRLTDNVEGKIAQIDTNLIDALGRVDSLKFDVYSGRQVVLESLARLEGKSEKSLLKRADSIVISLMDQQKQQNKSAGKGN